MNVISEMKDQIIIDLYAQTIVVVY